MFQTHTFNGCPSYVGARASFQRPAGRVFRKCCTVRRSGRKALAAMQVAARSAVRMAAACSNGLRDQRPCSNRKRSSLCSAVIILVRAGSGAALVVAGLDCTRRASTTPARACRHTSLDARAKRNRSNLIARSLGTARGRAWAFLDWFTTRGTNLTSKLA